LAFGEIAKKGGMSMTEAWLLWDRHLKGRKGSISGDSARQDLGRAGLKMGRPEERPSPGQTTALKLISRRLQP
jgi:hypothetical protein